MEQHKAINRKEDGCFICGSHQRLERHHIMGAFNRSNCEEDGLCVWLCHYHHNEPPNGVHYNRDVSIYLRMKAQAEYEKTHSHEAWMNRYGRNYL